MLSVTSIVGYAYSFTSMWGYEYWVTSIGLVKSVAGYEYGDTSVGGYECGRLWAEMGCISVIKSVSFCHSFITVCRHARLMRPWPDVANGGQSTSTRDTDGTRRPADSPWGEITVRCKQIADTGLCFMT